MSDMTIGDRIKARRTLSGQSIRQLADLAGISHTQWSRIERGQRSADNRFVLANIARALRCSVPDLTGESSTGSAPRSREDASLVGDVNSIVAALVETDLDDEATVAAVTPDQLAAEAALLDDLRSHSDYAAVARRLPHWTRQVHATAVEADDPADRTAALRLLVLGSDRTGGVLRNVGFRAESYLAGERARQAAEELGDPVMLAMSSWSRAHAALGCGSLARAHKIATQGLAVVDGHLDETGGTEIRGQLHLTAAMCLYGLGRSGEAEVHMTEAEALAERTGDTTTYRLWFGPTNLRLWRLAIEVDAGDPERAVEIARGTNPAPLTPGRQGAFYVDAARALSRIGKADADAAAVRMLETAERLTPQRVRHSPYASEALRVVLERTKRAAITPRLRGLAERLGVTSS